LRHNPGLSSVKQLQTKENQFNEIIITEYIYIYRNTHTHTQND